MAPEALLPRVDAVQEPAAKPNILLLFQDQWRWDWTTHAPTGAPPPALHTPNFDALAAAGVRFDYAYVPAPLCGPSRSALALGREHDMTTRNGVETMKSAVFASGSSRIPKSVFADTPGPGTYDPSYTQTLETLHDKGHLDQGANSFAHRFLQDILTLDNIDDYFLQ